MVVSWRAQPHLLGTRGGATQQSGGREGQVPRSRRRQTFHPRGERAETPAPPPRARSLARRASRGSPRQSCSGGIFLSLQLSEASPCPLLVSVLSVAHGLGAPVRGPAISHRLASLLP